MLDGNFRPYLEYALMLTKIKRKGLGNMFRHQIETMAILLEYGYTDTVLLKASLIHDFIEDAQKIDFRNTEKIKTLDLKYPKPQSGLNNIHIPD